MGKSERFELGLGHGAGIEHQLLALDHLHPAIIAVAAVVHPPAGSLEITAARFLRIHLGSGKQAQVVVAGLDPGVDQEAVGLQMRLRGFLRQTQDKLGEYVDLNPLLASDLLRYGDYVFERQVWAL